MIRPLTTIDSQQVLFQRRSERQNIELIKEADGSLSLTLDDYWQFSSRDEHVFHEVLVDPAMRVAPHAKEALILGGGDGLALRNVLRYPTIERVVLCEIDRAVIEMTRTVPEMAALTNNSLADPRVELLIGEALTYLSNSREQFEIVICDFPVSGVGRAAPRLDERLCELLAQTVTPDGVVTVQVSQEPREFWAALDKTAAFFKWQQARLVELANDEWADFILGSHAPISPKRDFSEELLFLNEQRAADILITNRSGDRFHTVAYGDEPIPDHRDLAWPRWTAQA